MRCAKYACSKCALRFPQQEDDAGESAWYASLPEMHTMVTDSHPFDDVTS
jgi:hypothetical protein